jgi:hypothetical protein
MCEVKPEVKAKVGLIMVKPMVEGFSEHKNLV